MIKAANNGKGKGRSSLSKQRLAIIIVALSCLILAVTLVVVNILTAQVPFEVAGEDGVKYYIIRDKDEEGNTYYYLADENKNAVDQTDDGYFVTKSGVLISINQTTGAASVYARPATDGNEQLGLNDRILIFPYTKRDQAQSIRVENSNGSFEFYRRRVYTDTDHTTYTCMLRDGKYVLLSQKDPSDPESEFIEYKRDADGYYTLASGNRVSINSRTGAIKTVSYVDFDGKIYTVNKNDNGEYVLTYGNGSTVTSVITKSGEKHDSEGKAYTAVLYHYYVTDFGTLINVDETYGTVSSWSIREYNPNTKKYSTFHFIKKDGKYVLADGEGALVSTTAIDDKEYYSTNNNAYIAFDEATGGYKVRIQKDYYLVANNDGVFTLYNKGTAVAANGASYYALPDGESYVYYDTASGSYTIFKYDGSNYKEVTSKYLNHKTEADLEGDFVIEGNEDVEYDAALFAALITNGGYTLTPAGGKLSNPEKLADGTVNFATYGLIECDRVNASGEIYHHVPASYVFTDLEGNVHKIYIGDQIASGGGYYVRYEGINTSESDMAQLDKSENGTSDAISHNAVYILLDNYSMGYTTSYEVFYYYSISDIYLAPVENLVTPKVIPMMGTTTYFDVKNFVISTLNYDKLHEDIMAGNDVTEGDYRDVWVNFTYYDIEERRNTVNASRPYVMGECELYGYNINDDSVNACLTALMDLKCKSTKKLSPSHADLVKYGLDEPEYILYYEFTATGEQPMLFISKLTQNDTYYVYSSIYDMIVEIDRGMLPFLSWSNNEWITQDFCDISIGFIDEIKVERGEWWASFDFESSLNLETKINTGAPSTFTQKILASDKRDRHFLSLSTNINGNTGKPSGTVEIIGVYIDTLQNYYSYIKNNKSTAGLSNEELKELKTFVDSVTEFNYDEKTGDLISLHKLSLSDGAGNVHVVSLIFSYNSLGDIAAIMQVNNESAVNVFSLSAYKAYEKIIFSDKVTAAEENLAHGFYLSQYANASATYTYDKITGENSDGEKIVITEHKTEKTNKDGSTEIEYFLSNDYRLFFDVNGEDLVGVARGFVRFYDMSDKDTTSGAYETIKNFPYEFTATQVRLVLPTDSGTKTIADGTLGDGSFTVVVTEDRVTVTDDKGNVTVYHRNAGTSTAASFYGSFMYATYEGVCELSREEMDAFIESGKWTSKITLSTKLATDENGKGTEYVYKTYQYSERRAFITLNDKGDFFVVRTFIDKIIDSAANVFNNAPIDSSDRYN